MVFSAQLPCFYRKIYESPGRLLLLSPRDEMAEDPHHQGLAPTFQDKGGCGFTALKELKGSCGQCQWVTFKVEMVAHLLLSFWLKHLPEQVRKSFDARNHHGPI